MDEYKYTLECGSCEARMELVVYDEDELPIYCPLCGEDVNEEWLKKDEDL